jgi:hypothetical protein
MYYNFRPKVFFNSSYVNYQPINNFLPVNKNKDSFFYYEDFWNVMNRNDIKYIILPEQRNYVLFPEPKLKPKLVIDTDLNKFAAPFSPKKSFFDIGEEVELEIKSLLEEEIEPNSPPEPMATLVKGEKRTSLNQTKHHHYRPKSKSPK